MESILWLLGFPGHVGGEPIHIVWVVALTLTALTVLQGQRAN
jgi:hypothetical protein